MEASLIVLCLIAGFTRYAACCDSGRIFLGSINETYPELVDRNGIYVRQSHDFDGTSLYKHESRDYYLYHVSGNMISSFWVIGPTPGSMWWTMSLQTSSASAEQSPEHWKVWNSAQKTWVTERHVKAACIDESFMTCTTGRLHLHGLSPWNHHQNNRTGYYYLTNETHEMRPVYQNENQQDFLFYVDGLWMVGPEVGRVSAGLFVLDYAWRPEYIIKTWIIFNGQQFLRDPKLTVRCAGNGNSANALTPPHESNEEIDASDIVNVAEGILHEGGEEMPVCGQYNCQNGGTCISNEVGDHLCACPEQYFGAHCDRSVDCGSPPEILNGDVVTETGSGFHALAFYVCKDNFVREGPSAIMCREAGWSSPPSCVAWLDHISPGISPTTPSRRRQRFMFMAGSGRHHNHHRSARSLRKVDIDQLKALFK